MKTLLLALGGFVAAMFVLALIPSILGFIIDPINKRKIKHECKIAGLEIKEIKSWPNHYGVKVEKNGKEHYLKCRGIFGKLTWKGKSPAQL